MVEKKTIPVSDFIYMHYMTKRQVNEKAKVPNLDKLLVSKNWVDSNMMQNTVKEISRQEF